MGPWKYVLDGDPDLPVGRSTFGRICTRHPLGSGCIQSSRLPDTATRMLQRHHAVAMQADTTITVASCYAQHCTQYKWSYLSYSGST